MRKIQILLLALTVGFSTTFMSCSNEDEKEPEPEVPADFANNVIEGNITKNSVVKNNGKPYLLKGFAYVKPGFTLTIEPGVVIKGDLATKASLIIEPGAKIIAEGTADKPIVFTSNQAKGSRKPGDWGGLILLGKAPVNKTPAIVEGENTTQFGGTDAADNSGILKYVRIEFAGIAFETDKEINGLTFGGVGSGTTVDYVQVSNSGDDAFEWFGGTVNAKHLISYRTLDDDFDTDNGFSGNVQYGLILRDPLIADQAGDSNGFESDNDASGTEALPKTSAKFANVSVFMGEGATIDSKYRSHFRIRRSSEISIYNTVSSGKWNSGGIELQDKVADNFLADKNKFQGLTVVHPTKPIISGSTDKFNTAAYKNKFLTDVTTLLLADLYSSLTAKPGLLPKAGSPLLTGGVTLPAGFEQNSYVGAFNTTDWTDKWANFNPQNTDY